MKLTKLARRTLTDLINILLIPVFHAIKRRHNVIIFAGQEGYDGNSRAVFEYMRKHCTTSYLYLWLGIERNCVDNDVITLPNKKDRTLIQELKFAWYAASATHFFYENTKISNYWTIPHRIYLSHGLPSYKNAFHYLKAATKHATDILATSPACEQWWQNGSKANVKGKSIFISGMPRNDMIEHAALKFSDYGSFHNKVIVWMPTFRVSNLTNKDGSKRCDSSADYLFGLPLIHSVNDLRQINSWCKTLEITLLIKPHPHAAARGIGKISYSNIRVWTNEWMMQQGIASIYQFFNSSAAMLGDYSSVSFDYLFTDKPQGFIIDDLEAYASTTGFAFPNIQQYMPGAQIRTLEELFGFLQDVANGHDTHAQERKNVHEWANSYRDFQQCERICKMFSLA